MGQIKIIKVWNIIYRSYKVSYGPMIASNILIEKENRSSKMTWRD